MRKFSEDVPRRYVVVDSDPYDSDLDGFYLYLNRTLGPDHAGRWLDELEMAINNLTGFPGPLSHARDEDASDHYGREVRRLPPTSGPKPLRRSSFCSVCCAAGRRWPRKTPPKADFTFSLYEPGEEIAAPMPNRPRRTLTEECILGR